MAEKYAIGVGVCASALINDTNFKNVQRCSTISLSFYNSSVGLGQDGFAISRKCVRSIMHNRLVLIPGVQRIPTTRGNCLKVDRRPARRVFGVKSYKTISISSSMFVSKANGMYELVLNNAFICAAPSK